MLMKETHACTTEIRKGLPDRRKRERIRKRKEKRRKTLGKVLTLTFRRLLMLEGVMTLWLVGVESMVVAPLLVIMERLEGVMG